jgi:hypothetical protein
LHQQVANAELFDEAQGLLARPRRDGQHADYGSYAEDDSEAGKQRPNLLRAQALGSAGEV